VFYFDKDWNGFFKRQEHLAGNHRKCIEHAGAAYKNAIIYDDAYRITKTDKKIPDLIGGDPVIHHGIQRVAF